MVREASHIGVIRGQHWQVLRGREGMPKGAHSAGAEGQGEQKGEARRRLDREIIDEYHRSLDGENGPLVRWLGGKLLERTGKATPPSTLRGDIKASEGRRYVDLFSALLRHYVVVAGFDKQRGQTWPIRLVV